jgi:chromosome segregation ATPase
MEALPGGGASAESQRNIDHLRGQVEILREHNTDTRTMLARQEERSVTTASDIKALKNAVDTMKADVMVEIHALVKQAADEREDIWESIAGLRTTQSLQGEDLGQVQGQLKIIGGGGVVGVIVALAAAWKTFIGSP